MSLAALSPKASAEAGVEVEILHPKTNLSLNTFVTVYGSDSDVCKKVQRKQLNRRMERQNRSRNNKGGLTAEELETEALEVLTACTKSWRTGDRHELEMNDGEWLACTPENVRRVFEELPWLKEQVDQEIGDRSNFLRG
ncbi:MAG: hypothetical protein H7Y05_12765 [Steroidobacteraceae bacterium]|nr:hypothetical protein [Deltaproteobacteria bacterium]